MSLESVQQYLQSHQQEAVEQLQELLRIPSISADSRHRADVHRAAEFVRDRLQAAGCTAELVETAGHPIVYGEWLGAPDAPTALVYGHYDVQPPDPLDEWASPPFEPTIRDGHIFARGATDDKGQMFTHIKSVDAWLQAVGKLPVKVRNLPVDYVSITGHKFGAPKGIGALYVQMNAPFVPLVHGGHQEHSRRGGTENVAGITALGVAAAVAMKKLADYDASIRPLRDALEEGILSSIPDAERNGNARQRLANTANVFLPGIDSDAVLTFLDSQDICASSGSACMESAITPSHVIKAMSGSHDRSSESIRFSLSSTNTFEEVKTVVMKISQLGDLVS